MNRLKDKVIVVTGAAMGQGAAEAALFAAEGAKVIAGDIAMEQLKETVDRINAAYPGSALAVKLDVSSGEDWDRAVAAGVEQFGGIQAVVPEMRKAGGGSIICVSSMAAYIGVGFNAYAPSKGGVRSLSRTASVTLGRENIRVNTIVPGTIETPMTAGMFDKPEVVQHCKDQTSLGYLGKPDDIAYGAIYLLSDESRFVTGAELVIDGGQRYKG